MSSHIIDLLYTFQSSVIFTASIVLCYSLGKWSRSIVESYTEKDVEALDVKERKKFLELFENDNHMTNSNIHPDLYCYEKYIQMIKRESEHETLWKSRIMFQNTPQGNLVMFYDLYKHAFGYFSDIQISYQWLNACAMKYVRIFYCRDFFLDNKELPENYKNPFNEMKLEEEKKEKEKKREKRKNLNIDFQSDAFLRKKKPDKKEGEKEETSKNEIRFINNFRRLGSIQNCKILNTVPYTNNLTNENGSKLGNKMNYKDFKKTRFIDEN